MPEDRSHRHPDQPAVSRQTIAILVWLLAVLALASYLYLNIISLHGENLVDFSVYYKALARAARGELDAIYQIDSKMPFLYPPFFLVLLRPLAGLSEPAALSLWLYLQSGFLLISLAALLAAVDRRDLVHAGFAVIMFAVFSPVMLNNRYGQTNPLYLALLSVFILGYVRGQDRGAPARVWECLAALALSAAISIRILPVGLLVMAGIQRRWLVAGLTAALVIIEAIATGAMVGFANEWQYFTSYIFHLRGLENMREISLLALAGRFLSSPADVALFASLAATGIGVFLWLVFKRMRDRSHPLALHPAFVITSMVLFAPLLEYHHYVILLAPYVLVLGELGRRDLLFSKAAIPLLLSWAIVSAANQLDAFYRIGSLGFVALAGTALLWIYIIHLIRIDNGGATERPASQ